MKVGTASSKTQQSATSRVLIFADYYRPGFAAGGPIVSLSRLIASEPTTDFRVVTRSHDKGSNQRYPFSQRAWHPWERAMVCYVGSIAADSFWLLREIWKWRPTHIYLNSAHSMAGTSLPLLLRLLRIFPQGSVVLAPRGELSVGALSLKSRKKLIGRVLLQLLTRWQHIFWQATSPEERADIVRWWRQKLPQNHRILCVPNIAPLPRPTPSRRADSTFTILFASRIDRKKGLESAIEIAQAINVDRDCTLIIAGAISQSDYWEEVQKKLKRLEEGLRVLVVGPYQELDLDRLAQESDALVLPTRGENFGHVIAEFLSRGLPVVCPDTTPWSTLLRSGCGYVMTSSCDAVDYLNFLANLDNESRERLRINVNRLYTAWYNNHSGEGLLFSILGSE